MRFRTPVCNYAYHRPGWIRAARLGDPTGCRVATAYWSGTTTILSILAVLGVISALGAVWARLGKHRHRRLAPSDADQTRAQQTLDYYAKVRDSTVQ